MQTLKDHFRLVGAVYLGVLRSRNDPQKVYQNYEAPDSSR
jgi:hypothetical protein